MKFDTIIIGGGLSGLTCAIQLTKTGQRVAVVSAGQSTLHFHSGSFELLGYNEDGTEVTDLVDGLKKLSTKHPYSRMGTSETLALAKEARQLLTDIGISTKGDGEKNHYRLTPIGGLKPAWLTIEDFFTTDSAKAFPYKKVTLVNIEGFLDLPIDFLKDSLEKAGVTCEVKTVNIKELCDRRRSQTEMRASNLAKIMANEDVVRKLAQEINNVADGEAVLLPAIIKPSDKAQASLFKSQMKQPFHFVVALPPSVPGIAIQELLRKKFYELGGRILMGDEAVKVEVANGTVKNIETENLQDTRLEADNFVLATGSFMSRGLRSNYAGLYEPLFGLDIDGDNNRTTWTQDYVFDAQPYMQFGVHTDENFRATKDGKAFTNLYVIGSALSGHNAVKMADGTGVSLLTAMYVAKKLTDRKEK